MDILLIKTGEGGSQIKPCSSHGMLWLQTHFEECHWESLSNNQVRIPNTTSSELTKDAEEAGLILNSVPVISSRTNLF